MKHETVDNEIDYYKTAARLICEAESFRITWCDNGHIRKWYEVHFDDEGREVRSERNNGEVNLYKYDSNGKTIYRGYTAPTRGGKVRKSA